MMLPLSDASNHQQQAFTATAAAAAVGGASKRPRLSQLAPADATFAAVVERAGIRGLGDDDAAQQQDGAPPPELDDPRHTRRQLQADLATAAAQQTFLASLAEVIESDERLRRCLLPISVTVAVSYATGDSLIRLLLNMLPLQQRLATMLLQKLPEFSEAECEDGGEAAGHVMSCVASLILGQLRWLEVVADTCALTDTVFETLHVCAPSTQRQLVGILPEIVQPQDQGGAVAELRKLLESDIAFMACVLECLSNMQLQPSLQAEVLEFLAAQLPAVEVEDLPSLVRFLVAAAARANAQQVLTTVRTNLHFASPTDPRLAVADRRQKGVTGRSSPEVAVVRELVSALQANKAAEAAALQLQAALTEPTDHGVVDLVVLVALHTKAGDSRKAAEACLKRKLLEGHVNAATWLSKALQAHQACYREQLWPSLLALAESWSSAREAPVSSAAVSLYVQLFVAFDAPLERQQVLHALHGHLGSGLSGQQDVALQALGVLAASHCPLLRDYSSYIANTLDHLETFSNAQLQQVFAMFAALTARQPGAVPAAAAGSSGAGSSSRAAAAAATAGGSRLEDELVIMLNKALAQPQPGYKRIGVVGSLALLQREGGEFELLDDADGSAAEAALESWVSRAESVFAQCMSQSGVFAFMLDQWAELLEAQARRRDAGSTSAAAVPQPRMPGPMLTWLTEKVNDIFMEAFTVPMETPAASQLVDGPDSTAAALPAGVQLDDPHLKAELWCNLDGVFSPACIKLLPMAASKDASNRSALVWMAPAARVLAAVSCLRQQADMEDINGLLGCPLVLPERSMFADGRWDGLPLASKVAVLASLQHGVCWLRELVAVFAPCFSSIEAISAAMGSEDSQETMANLAAMQNKLVMRLTQLHALEALLCHLVASCPAAAQQLCDVSYPLLMSAPRKAVAAASALGKADAAGGSASGGGVLATLRCLRPPAALALTICPPPDAALTLLLPATHLAADLHSKLKLLISRAKRPAGLTPHGGGAGATAAAAGGGSSAVLFGGGGRGPSGPPCLEGVALREFVERVLQPLLPALQQHLVTALQLIKQPEEAGLEALLKDLPGSDSPAEAALHALPPVAAVLDESPAATQLSLSCLQMFTLLLGCIRDLLPQGVLHHALAALAVQAAPAAGDQPQVPDLVVAAFKGARKLSCRSSGNSSLQLELAVVSLLQAVVAVGAGCGVPANKQQGMCSKLTMIAAELLQESWEAHPDEAQEGDTGSTWKGQTAAITQLLTVLISLAADPSLECAELLNSQLSQLPDKVPPKEQLAPVGSYASMCAATFNTWYKVVFEQLLAAWQQLMQRGMALLRAANQQHDTQAPEGAAGGRKGGRGKQKQQLALPVDGFGRLQWDEEQAGEVLAVAQRYADVFAGLVELTKKHASRNMLLSSALKLGSSFLEVMLKALPFWAATYVSDAPGFTALVKSVQKGTKVMQHICGEGKTRGAAVVSQTPAAKRSLERFVCEMHALFVQAGEPQENIKLGFLKHRNLGGTIVASQLYPDAQEEDEDEDDEDGQEGEEYGGDDEEEGSAAA